MHIFLLFQRISFFLLIFLLEIGASAQSDEEQQDLPEQLIENNDPLGDYSDLADLVNTGTNRLLNLNKASAFELLSTNMLTPAQVNALIKHRLEFGSFVSILELQTIDELDPDIIKKLLPVLAIKESPPDVKSLARRFKIAEKNITFSTAGSKPYKKGFQNTAKNPYPFYSGSPFQCRLRFRVNDKKGLSFGFNAEKDEGEDFFMKSNRAGFDFYSAHFFINKKGFIRKIALGDFQAGFGQGLTMASGLGFGKSASVMNVKRINTGLRPYSSFNESDYLRGTGITLGYKRLVITSFISRHRIDAHVDTLITGSTREIVATSFVTDGYHRSSSEIDKEKSALKTLIGQDVTYTGKSLAVGLTSILNLFNMPLETEDKVYNRFYFSGKRFAKAGLHFDYYCRNINLFGEATIGTKNSSGYILGAMISLSNNLDVVMTNRYYSKSFIWYNTNAFSENSNPNNEKGTYLGLNIKLTKRLTLSGFVDFYKLPWYSFYADGRGKGSELLTEINWRHGRSAMIYVRLRFKQELKNNAFENYNSLNWCEKANLRFHAENMISHAVKLKVRIEFSNYITPQNKPYTGNLVFFDLTYKKTFSPVSINARIAWFNIENFDSRIYAVESDILYSWSVPAFMKSGTKLYILTKYKWKKNISIQCRYSMTAYYDNKTIGSGYEEIASDKLHEINLMISYRFK